MMLRWISLVPPMIDVGARRQEPEHPGPVVDRVVVGRQEQGIAPQHRERGLVQPLAHPRPEQLDQARLRAELVAPLEPSERPLVVEAEDLDVDPGCRQPLPSARVGRPAARPAGRGQPLDRHLMEHLLLPDERRAPLVGQRRVRHAPTLVLRTDDVADRDLDVVEEDLVELALTGDLAQRADLDAGRVHGDRQHRDPLVVGRGRIGPDERDAPVGKACVRRPHLLPGHSVDVATLLGARREARRGRSRRQAR